MQELCNCGRPTRYTHLVDGEMTGSCNKYAVCPSYESLLVTTSTLTRHLSAYQEAVNKIDDFFEYSNESLSDRKKIHMILGNLTEKLQTIQEKANAAP